MMHSIVSRYALSSAALALFVGCGGSQPPIGAPGTMPQSRAIATHAERGGSWMLPGAKGDDLLYVSVYDDQTSSGNVFVFSYSTQRLVGTLSGFFNPTRACVDNTGDVFITDFGNGQTVEYSHGGTQPIEILKSPTFPIGCSVNATTGNLAVANVPYGNYRVSLLSIYRNAKGSPENFHNNKMANMEDCAYDNRGRIIAVGWKGYTNYRSVFAMLLKRKAALKIMTFKGEPHGALPQSVQWDGKYLAVTESDSIVQFAVSGRTGEAQGQTNLTGAGSVFASWITQALGSVVVASTKPEEVEYYNYPAGGSPTAKISFQPYQELGGVAVSLAPRR